MKKSPGIRVEIFKRKDCLVKINIVGYINSAGSNFKTLYPVMARIVSKEDTPCGSERKLAFVVRSKIGPTCAAKDAKRGIIWVCSKEMMHRSIIIYHFS